MHARDQVQQGIALRSDCANRFGLFPYRGASRAALRTRWASADSCLLDSLGAPPRQLRIRVAFTDGAGGMGDLASMLAHYCTHAAPEAACPSRVDALKLKAAQIRQSRALAQRVADLQAELLSLRHDLMGRRHDSTGRTVTADG
jgi:hypothetical protein